MTRRVDDVDLHTIPVTGGSSRGDGDTTLLLLLHPVHGGGTIMNFTDLVVDAGVEKDALGGRGLASVDMRHDANVAHIGQVNGGSGCHGINSESQVVRGRSLPAVVREGLVGLGHLVHVFTALDAGAKTVAGVEQLVHEALGHGLLTTLT